MSVGLIEGYAIVSEDGMLADAARVMPETLIFEADQRFFEQGLDKADVVVHGRHSQERQTRSHLRPRLIVTSRITDIAPHPSNKMALLWNPLGASLDDALIAIGKPDANIGVIGGTDTFALFLNCYDVFYLTRAPGAYLPGGRPVFPGVPARTPEEILTSHGLIADAPQMLDAAKRLVMVSWRRG